MGGRSRRINRRSSRLNSARPGITGKYVKFPRRRLPGSSRKTSGVRDIAQSLLTQRLENGGPQPEPILTRARPVFHALELHGKARDVDAVADRVAFVGGVSLLQEIGDVVENVLFAEGQVLFQNRVFFVALGEIDGDLRLETGV